MQLDQNRKGWEEKPTQPGWVQVDVDNDCCTPLKLPENYVYRMLRVSKVYVQLLIGSNKNVIYFICKKYF